MRWMYEKMACMNRSVDTVKNLKGDFSELLGEVT